MFRALSDKIFDPDAGVYGHWFTGAQCNTCYNCLDRHVESGRGDQAALIYDSPITGSQKTFTYSELLDEVAAFGAGLQDLGIGKGDRVIIYMPMIPEAAIAMLACARIGAIHSVVFGGFAAAELATRIDDAKPNVIAGNGAEFVAVDSAGNLYAGEPKPRNLQKYVRVRP